jgi:hypothetical protein
MLKSEFDAQEALKAEQAKAADEAAKSAAPKGAKGG